MLLPKLLTSASGSGGLEVYMGAQKPKRLKVWGSIGTAVCSNLSDTLLVLNRPPTFELKGASKTPGT